MSYQEEFNRLFSNSCSLKNTDWNAPRYFDASNNDCYKAEAALVSSLTSEAYNMYGFKVDYYIKDVNVKRDKLMGEDPLENIVRRFELSVYADNVPQLQKQYQLQGMGYTEVVTLQCSIDHFFDASKIDYLSKEETYQQYYPRIGDIMYLPWCDLYYEILNVKEFAEGTSFLTKPITFQFSLRVWKNSHENVDYEQANDDQMEHLRNYVELGETFNMDFRPVTSNVEANGDMLSINDDLKQNKTKSDRGKDNIKEHALYTKENEGKQRIDPWDGW